MADGFDKLQEQIDRLRTLNVAEEAAPYVAKHLELFIRSNISKGVGPDGKPWPLTQSGKKALQDAARAVTVKARGTVVLATLKGIEALHHKGQARGGVRRAILPTRKAMQPVTAAIKKTLGERFQKHMGAV